MEKVLLTLVLLVLVWSNFAEEFPVQFSFIFNDKQRDVIVDLQVNTDL